MQPLTVARRDLLLDEQTLVVSLVGIAGTPINYLRGRSIHDAVVIVDDART